MKMEMKSTIFLLFVLSAAAKAASWNNLNCPAPRAPDNGLSFIFRNGEMVHFRCHPGYQMRGHRVAYCENNEWTYAAPECIPIRKRSFHYDNAVGQDNITYHYRHATHPPTSRGKEEPRELFNWGDQTSKQNVYGDGPRRLPLINGIWPPQEHAEQVLALGPQSTPGPRTMVKEEIDIAELRNKQLEELKQQRYKQDKGTGKRRQGRKKNKNSVIDHNSIPRETIVSLGTTEDGQALSVAFAKPVNDTGKSQLKHKYRHHRGGRKKKHSEKKKKFYAENPGYSNFITSRKSRVNSGGVYPYDTGYQIKSTYPVRNDVAELRRRPVEQVKPQLNHTESLAEYDTTCVESMYRREVPMIAPQLHNAFVYRYETRRNKLYPFNSYMVVKYKCLGGFVFTSTEHTLYCKEGSWTGEIPRCVASVGTPNV